MTWLIRITFAALMGLVLAGAAAAASPKPLTRSEALNALTEPSPEARLLAVARLADIGVMADADRLVATLRDSDDQVRELAGVAMWQIWSRSGDKTIDAQYQTGVQLMEASRMGEALSVFNSIIRRRPQFAEAWNKRATLYFLVGEYELSLKDCDEVLKRNRNHFGALSGYGQIYLALGDFDRALVYLKRAHAINPNMPGSAEAIGQLERRLRDRRDKMI